MVRVTRRSDAGSIDEDVTVKAADRAAAYAAALSLCPPRDDEAWAGFIEPVAPVLPTVAKRRRAPAKKRAG